MLTSIGVFFAEAMDRIHRLGQYRPVEAIKIVVEDSIESRIVQVRNPNTAQSLQMSISQLLK